QIERPTGRHVRARWAGAAGVAVGGPLAVHGLEQDARDARLARAAWPAEEIGVGDLTRGHRVAERARDVLLAEHVGEPTGAPAEVKRAVIGALAHGHPPAVTAVAAGAPVAGDGR